VHALPVLVSPAAAIVASSLANPTVVETETPHGFVTGDTVAIVGHVGSTPALDGSRVVTRIDASHFSVPVNVSVAGAGGTVTRTLARLPLTIAEGKLAAGLDWLDGDPRDAQMLTFIGSATAKVQNDTGLILLLQTFDVWFDALCTRAPVFLPWRPIASLVSVDAIDSAGGRQSLDVANYNLDPGSEAPLPARAAFSTIAWPTDLRAFQPWVLRLMAGWPSVAEIPPSLLHAVAMLTAHYATVGRDLVQVGTIVATTPLGYEEVIAPYQLVVVG